MKAIFYLILITMFAACAGNEDRKDGFSETPKNTEDSLFQDVMDQHDVAMAKMGRLSGYRKQIQQKLDSLGKVKSSTNHKKKLQDLDSMLKQAEDEMNTWMHEFSIDSAQDDTQRRIQYLSSEKERVTKVKEEVLAAMAHADTVLNK